MQLQMPMVKGEKTEDPKIQKRAIDRRFFEWTLERYLLEGIAFESESCDTIGCKISFRVTEWWGTPL